VNRGRDREAGGAGIQNVRTREMLERLSDGWIELSSEGNVLTWSDGAERIFGWKKSEALGVELAALVVPEGRREAYARVLARSVEGASGEIELELSRHDGRTVRSRLFLVTSEDSPPRVLVGLKKLEERRRKHRGVDHTTLENLGLFAGGIAHDFNNLLLTVIGNANLARRDLKPDSPAHEHLVQIEQAAKRATELTSQILAFAGRASFRAEPVDLDRLLERTLADLRPLTREADIRLELEKRPIPIHADAAQLRQLVANLVSNAVDALDAQEGQIVVRAGDTEIDPEALQLYFCDEELPGGCYAFLEITDSGCGMDAVTQVRMFEPFFSTKFAGRGLGLPAVLGIIRAHEGALNVYSEPGRGTRIRVLLPAPGEATPSQRRRSTRADQGVVVVADDEDAVRRVTTAMLEKSGYRVYSARDGREAVELVLQQGNDVKALLLDMAMPEMGGIEALQTLRELDCSVPVILSSGLVDIDALECLSEHERVRVLQKPFRAADLLGMLHELAT